MICHACAWEADFVKNRPYDHSQVEELNATKSPLEDDLIGHAYCIRHGSQCGCQHKPVGSWEGIQE